MAEARLAHGPRRRRERRSGGHVREGHRWRWVPGSLRVLPGNLDGVLPRAQGARRGTVRQRHGAGPGALAVGEPTTFSDDDNGEVEPRLLFVSGRLRKK